LMSAKAGEKIFEIDGAAGQNQGLEDFVGVM
jgi:hypothetical protein